MKHHRKKRRWFRKKIKHVHKGEERAMKKNVARDGERSKDECREAAKIGCSPP